LRFLDSRSGKQIGAGRGEAIAAIGGRASDRHSSAKECRLCVFAICSYKAVLPIEKT